MTTMNSETSSQNSGSLLTPSDEKKIIAWTQDRFTQMRNARWKAERQWYLNLAFYFGQQNVAFKGGSDAISRNFQLYTPPAPYYRSRPVINRIRPLVRTEMAKLTAQKPSAFVVPASSDDRDIFAAHAAEQIWDSLYRWKKVGSVLRRAVFWSSLTGNGFIKSWWDETKLDDISNQMGDICYSAETPYHVFIPDLKEESLENQPYIIHACMYDFERLQNLYGKQIKFQSSAESMIDESFLNVMQVQPKTKRDQMLVQEVWVKPGATQLFPEGGMFAVAGNQILSMTRGWPYSHNQYPFAHIGHVQSGKFYRDSVIVDLIPLQKEYNRTRGQIIEAKNRMAKPQLAAEIGSVDPAKITSEPGQVILYRPGFQAPTPIPLQGLPAYVLEEVERIKDDMNEISGQHDVSRGTAPPGVTAATAISYLQEQDDTKLSYTFDSIEEAVEKIAYQSLNYVKQYWDTPRKVKVTGLDGSFDVLAFEGSDLRDNTDVRVEGGSALPTSRAAKQAFIMDLMKMGFIDPNKGLEVMEIGGINKIFDQIQIDVRQAQRENLKMAQVDPELVQMDQQMKTQQFIESPQGQMLVANKMLIQGPDGNLMDLTPLTQGMPPAPIDIPLIVPVNNWDDHRIHIERHNNYRKSQAFDQLDDASKKLFDDHVQGHVRAIMVGAQAAMPPEMMNPALQQPQSAQEIYKESLQQQNPSTDLTNEPSSGGNSNGPAPTGQ